MFGRRKRTDDTWNATREQRAERERQEYDAYCSSIDDNTVHTDQFQYNVGAYASNGETVDIEGDAVANSVIASRYGIPYIDSWGHPDWWGEDQARRDAVRDNIDENNDAWAANDNSSMFTTWDNVGAYACDGGTINVGGDASSVRTDGTGTVNVAGEIWEDNDTDKN